MRKRLSVLFATRNRLQQSDLEALGLRQGRDFFSASGVWYDENGNRYVEPNFVVTAPLGRDAVHGLATQYGQSAYIYKGGGYQEPFRLHYTQNSPDYPDGHYFSSRGFSIGKVSDYYTKAPSEWSRGGKTEKFSIDFDFNQPPLPHTDVGGWEEDPNIVRSRRGRSRRGHQRGGNVIVVKQLRLPF